MCGILGVAACHAEQYNNVIRLMTGVLKHRGPDEQNSTVFENCILGHVRLSIIDLASGQQPMFSPVKNEAIVFNGEIYGFKDIKDKFSDYPFRNNSDTEVILALYDRYGKEMMPYLPGAFAFAIWDEEKQALFGARDRFGEKPLYYAFGENGEFIFASEIKAIIASGLLVPEIDPASMGHMLKYRYVHPSKTIYKNIFAIPPAHCFRYSNGNLKIEKYWSLPPENKQISEAEAVEKFEGLLAKSVKKMMVADVPVGAFLSGGLDSTTIVAEAVKHNSKLTTFSFGYNGELNELPYARAAAEMYGTNHIELTDSRNDLADLFVEMQTLQDEPFADMAQIPLYILSKEAARHNKVVLAGDGADELLAGYLSLYHPLYKFDKGSRSEVLKLLMAKSAYKMLRLFGIKSRLIKNKVNKQKEFVNDLNSGRTQLERHMLNWQVIKDDALQEMGLSGRTTDVIPDFETSNTTDDALRCDLLQYLPGDILVKSDRIMMANSLECRLPFLDVELAEFLISTPVNLKLNEKVGKLPMRKAYETKWPKLLQNRPKQGFWVPDELWQQRDDFQNLINEYLRDPHARIFKYLDFNGVQKNLKYNIWYLLSLAVWLETKKM